MIMTSHACGLMNYYLCFSIVSVRTIFGLRLFGCCMLLLYVFLRRLNRHSTFSGRRLRHSPPPPPLAALAKKKRALCSKDVSSIQQRDAKRIRRNTAQAAQAKGPWKAPSMRCPLSGHPICSSCLHISLQVSADEALSLLIDFYVPDGFDKSDVPRAEVLCQLDSCKPRHSRLLRQCG